MIVDVLRREPEGFLCQFHCGRWDGAHLRTQGKDGRPHDRLWMLREQSGTVTWSSEYLPGAQRYRWDGATSDVDQPTIHFYIPDTVD